MDNHCQEASFARAHCRVDIREDAEGLTTGRYVATAAVVDREANELHPLVFRDGSRVSFPAGSAELALNTMLTYLEEKFGAFSEIVFGCLPETQSARVGAPVVVEP